VCVRVYMWMCVWVCVCVWKRKQVVDSNDSKSRLEKIGKVYFSETTRVLPIGPFWGVQNGVEVSQLFSSDDEEDEEDEEEEEEEEEEANEEGWGDFCGVIIAPRWLSKSRP